MPDTQRPQSFRLRTGRFSEPYGLYFVTKCLKANGVFSEDQRKHVIDTFCHMVREKKWFLHAFVIMPDHWHILFSLREDTSLSRTIEYVSRRISFPSRQGGLPGMKWQTGFYDHKVRPGESVTDIVDYIENNPVKKGLCPTSEAWPWSSRNPKYTAELQRDFLGHERWTSRVESRI